MTSCSFCGVSAGEVKFLMQGPTAAICGECVTVAVGMMARREGETIDHRDTLMPGEKRLPPIGRREE